MNGSRGFSALLFSLEISVMIAVLFSGCMMPGGPGSELPQMKTAEKNSLSIGGLENLWNERTIYLTPESGGRRFPPFAENNSQGGRGGLMPLSISATLMDSILISGSLNEFSNLASMSKEEKDNYIKRYNEAHPTEDYYFVWLELSTPYAKEVIDPDKWSIYLTDEKDNQIEPDKIIEFPSDEFDGRNKMNSGINHDPFGSHTLRIFQLYFPAGRVKALNLFSPGTKATQLVFYNWSSDMHYRGEWNIKPDNTFARR